MTTTTPVHRYRHRRATAAAAAAELRKLGFRLINRSPTSYYLAPSGSQFRLRVSDHPTRDRHLLDAGSIVYEFVPGEDSRQAEAADLALEAAVRFVAMVRLRMPRELR